MPFRSILFDDRHDATLPEAAREVPDFFTDLMLDQIVDAATAGREEYDLGPFFSIPLRDAEAIEYRHGVLQDLEVGTLRMRIEAFSKGMREMRAHLAQSDALYYEYPKAIWFLDAAGMYCQAVSSLSEGLRACGAQSKGLRTLSEHLEAYVGSDAFASLASETQRVQRDLSELRYRVHIDARRVTVSRDEDEAPDYSAEIEATFEKFRQGAEKDYRIVFPSHPEMSHVESRILDSVSRLFPQTFQSLRAYSERHCDFLDEAVGRFDREVQFYLAYLELIDPLRTAALPFCYPTVSHESKEVHGYETFDLALAHKLHLEHRSVVCNDFFLEGEERVFVVSGPNQGGKTTFARAFGQLHYLACLGLPVPGRDARLFLCDRLFTHFEREEQLADLQGRLQDELVRFREILDLATTDSIIIMNESFASTTLKDALFIGREVLGQIVRRDILCVYVTFLDELSTYSGATVSMVSAVDPSDPTTRTYKVVRRPANGLAYAIAIAEKHRLTYASLKRRTAR